MSKISLATKKPEILKDWHSSKNGKLTPYDVTYGSHKRVWWKCQKGHEWEAKVCDRNNGSNCPYCSGNKVCNDNSLATLNPLLALQWHLNKNESLTPHEVTCNSHKKVWWKCPKGHEWTATVAHRNNGRNCPYCIGRKTCNDNSLASLNLDLAKEWHPTKNRSLTPHDVTCNSNKKVWWQCSKGHEWESMINSRNRGTNCPICSESLQTSFPELAIYFYVKNFFKDALHRSKPFNTQEIDVYIPSIHTGIEYDGDYYHKDAKRDQNKENKIRFNNKDIILYRIREGGCPNYTKQSHRTFVYTRSNSQNDSLEASIRYLLNELLPNFKEDKEKIVDLNRDHIAIRNLISYFEKDDSLLEKNPLLAEQWHPLRNGLMSPCDVTCNSNKKVWWLCSNGHEWESKVCARSQGNNCPYCSGKKVCDDNSIATINPVLAEQWHPTKNGSFTPHDFTCGSQKKSWWLCQKGHEWVSTITNRNKGNNCPYCSGKKAFNENALATINPILAGQWHPTKNRSLMPNDVTCSSNKKVWWLCQKGHEWKAMINCRNKGTNCPYCSGRKTFFGNCLATLKPSLSAQWHPTKNGSLTPHDVTCGSNKKVWWLCQKGHEWDAIINSRNKGSNCPYCSGRKAKSF